MATIFKETIILETCCCAACGITYAIPENYKDKLRRSHETFYCPNGHSQWFPQKSEAEKLRDELKRKEQELADRVQMQLAVKKDLDEANRKLKRLKNGVCPCCNRSFCNLQNHMKKQHPEYRVK